MNARLRLLGAALVGAAALVGFGLRAEATTVQYTTKVVSISVLVTPSPAPVGFLSPQRAVRTALRRRELARAVPQAAAPLVVAQVTSSQKSAKVNVTTKADPTGAYLKISPNNLALSAQYGTNTYLCAFKINATFVYAWKVTDWVYGSSSGAAGVFPSYDYPTTSDLAWSAEGFSTKYTSYANQGSPGELAFSAAANTSKSVCIDLKLTVPNTVAAGSYSTAIQYNLYVSY